MAAAFGLPIEELEKLIVGLIQSGNVKGRVDSRNKVDILFSTPQGKFAHERLQILKANIVDQRAALFSRAANAGVQIQSTNRKLLLRMRL